MARWRYRRLLREAWHPPDEELLLFVEGEADARAARQVSDHLAGCWTCLARRADIERAIGAYMAYHRDPAHEAGGSGNDPDQATRRFAATLARAKDAAPPQSFASVSASADVSESAAERVVSFFRRSWHMPAPRRGAEATRDERGSRERSSLERSPGWPHRWKRQRAERGGAERSGVRRFGWTLARAAALLAVIAIAARWWLAPTPVSARELLARVDRAQQQEIAAVADPVIYQRLHASRAPTGNTAASANDTVTWEVWSSQRQRRIVERVSASSPLLHDLQAVLRENGMEPGQPLSAGSLTAWRRFAGHVAEDVRVTKLADGVDAVALTSSAPGAVQAGRIARSEVIVRTRDWHPVAHILTVAGAAGQRQRYTITELNYSVLPFTTVDATVFNPPAVAAPSIEAAESAGDAAPTTAPPALPTHAARAALLALYEQHTSGACLEVRPGDPSPQPSPRTRGEGAARPGILAQPVGREEGEGNGADAAVRHLWAIRQLAEWYRSAQADGVERGLDGRSRAMLATMIREHLEAARQHLPSSGETTSIEEATISPNEPWTTVAMKAYAAVEYASRADTLEGTDAAEAVARARALLRSLDAAVQRFAQGPARAGASDAPRAVTAPQHRR